MKTIRSIRCAGLACILLLGAATAPAQRVETRLEKGWRFTQGDPPQAEAPSFDDSRWQEVTVPHDWAIFGPFDREHDLQRVVVTQNLEKRASLKTGRTGGLPYVGTGWYRTTFRVPAGRCATLVFDGAMSEARVYVNGREACFWPYGYNAFHCDVTELLVPGDNLLAVRLENRPNSSRWYPGAGLYRHVRLVVTDPVHVPVWGTQITTPRVRRDSATICLKTEVAGAEGRTIEIRTRILAPDGRTAASGSCRGRAVADSPFVQHFVVEHPRLWSPESPSLYRAVTTLYADGRPVDTYRTRFGIRSLDFIPHRGFYLNGERRKFRGVCNHHDLGPLGAAVNRSALRHQLSLLRDMGCDAIRTAHNMPAPELAELCDEMGFMLMIEPFDEWDIAKCENGYHRYFDQWAERDMVNMLRQFRNCPSVVMWSIGNEVPSQCSPDGYRTAQFLQEICHREDPTRPVTCGMDQADCVLANGFAALIDIPGLNYRTFRYREAYDKLPQGLVLGSETASTVSSRGVYKLPAEKRYGATDPDHQCSAYDLDACGWSNIPDVDFALADDYDWTLGQFVWTGFDYLGEPSPYDKDAWPNHSSMFGILDLASLPKDRYYLYRSVWNRTDPTLHVLPHWNWAGHEGERIPVFVYTSWPEAELFVNGVSCGRRRKGAGDVKPVAVSDRWRSNYADYVYPPDSLLPSGAEHPTRGCVNEPVETRYRLMWPEAVYRPGELRVVAYDDRGRAVAEKVVRTAGKPARIELTTPTRSLSADGRELAYVTARIVDGKGTTCPLDGREMTFEVTGAGSYRAAANGDPTCLDLFHLPRMHAFNGMLTVIVRAAERPGTLRLEARAEGLESGRLEIPVVSTPEAPRP